jgi:hypothetical protein
MAARAAKPTVATRHEVLVLLSQAARRGHVPAMRLLLEEVRRDGNQDDQASDFIDELATKRERATGP